MRKPVYGICEQHRCRSACASAHRLPRGYNTCTCYIRNFKTLACFSIWVLHGRNSRRKVFSWHGSTDDSIIQDNKVLVSGADRSLGESPNTANLITDGNLDQLKCTFPGQHVPDPQQTFAIVAGHLYCTYSYGYNYMKNLTTLQFIHKFVFSKFPSQWTNR